jgi:hypothetical protein
VSGQKKNPPPRWLLEDKTIPQDGPLEDGSRWPKGRQLPATVPSPYNAPPNRPKRAIGVRRGAGAVDRDGLENRCTPRGYRGFESLPLRQYHANTNWRLT